MKSSPPTSIDWRSCASSVIAVRLLGEASGFSAVIVAPLMGCPASSCGNASTTTAAAARARPVDAGIRVFTVSRTPKAEPAEDVQGSWKVAGPTTVDGFTAAGYYFAHALRAELEKKAKDIGLWMLDVPEEYGGAGLGVTEAAIMMEAISGSGAGMSGVSAIHMNIFGLNPVVVYGTHEQKKRMLPPLVSGDERACLGITEPDAFGAHAETPTLVTDVRTQALAKLTALRCHASQLDQDALPWLTDQDAELLGTEHFHRLGERDGFIEHLTW